MNVGERRARVKVYGSSGWKKIDALVDTVATFTKTQASVAQEIGIEPKYDQRLNWQISDWYKENLA